MNFKRRFWGDNTISYLVEEFRNRFEQMRNKSIIVAYLWSLLGDLPRGRLGFVYCNFDMVFSGGFG